MEGIPVRDIEQRLKERYPKKRQDHLRISFSTVQNFKTSYLNMKGEILKDIKEATYLSKELMKQEAQEARDTAIQEEVRSTSAYQEKINQIVDTQINVQEQLVKLYNIIEARMEYFFNKLEEHEFPNVKEERAFQNYIDQFMRLLEYYKKFVEGFKDGTEHNININIMNDQVVLLRDAIREVFTEIEPDLAVKFMHKLNSKMKDLVYRSDGIGTDLILDEVILDE